ncbi:MAG: family 10 glycosylhydrolase [Synechococcaceae cyanobacterium]|nr:family 10 glycosylhydrolase [Synechococcaceae cyanobacterium]
MSAVRGVWLSHLDGPAYGSPAALAEAIRFLADAGFSHVFPVVWNRGFTFFPSRTMARTFGADRSIDPAFRGRDPLAEIVAAAQGQRLRVIPWFEFGFAAAFGAEGAHLLEARPSWAARDRSGAPLTRNGFSWMNSLDGEVQTFLIELITEVVSRYPVDGIQGDDRLPALPVEGGHEAATLAAWRAASGRPAPRRDRDPHWMAWRSARLTDFLERLRREVKALRPEALISMAPGPHPFAYRHYLQDWPSWLERGLVDLLHPQLYRHDASAYRRLLRANLAAVPPAARPGGPGPACTFAPGLLLMAGAYRARPETLRACLRHNRSLGVSGEVLFHYQGLRTGGDAAAGYLRGIGYPEASGEEPAW